MVSGNQTMARFTLTHNRVLAGKERADSVERSLPRQPPVVCRADSRQKCLQEISLFIVLFYKVSLPSFRYV